MFSPQLLSKRCSPAYVMTLSPHPTLLSPWAFGFFFQPPTPWGRLSVPRSLWLRAGITGGRLRTREGSSQFVLLTLTVFLLDFLKKTHAHFRLLIEAKKRKQKSCCSVQTSPLFAFWYQNDNGHMTRSDCVHGFSCL